MNIFAFNNDPYLSALWLDDVRKNKMIVETAQLLSSAIRINNPFTDLEVYKMTHQGHPCTQWARASRYNFSWLISYMTHLGNQWGKHKSLGLLPAFVSYSYDGWFPNEALTPFPNCTTYKHVPDVHEAYRAYMCDKWSTDTIKVSWNKGTKPEWYT